MDSHDKKNIKAVNFMEKSKHRTNQWFSQGGIKVEPVEF